MGKLSLKLLKFYSKLRDENLNGVWAWFIKNLAQPYRLAKAKVDRIVGNPPWITYNDWSSQRQNALTQMAKDIDVWVGGKSAPQMELACIFTASIVKTYLDPYPTSKATFGFVLPASSLKANSWKKFRTTAWHANVTLSAIQPWLVDTNPPAFSQVTSCAVIFGCCHNTKIERIAPGPFKYCTLSGTPTDELLFTAPHCFLKQASPFLTLISNGATIFPKNLVCIQDRNIKKASARTVQITTYLSPRAKKPWRTIGTQTDVIEQETLVLFIDSHDLLPFHFNQQFSAILPPNEIPQGKFPKHAEYWHKAERIWQKNRKNKSPLTLADQVNYYNKLTSSLKNSSPILLYNASGLNISAVVIEPNRRLIHSHSTYRVMTDSFHEAYFLAALLNSDILHAALIASRTNDRHFDTLPFQVIPFPRYDEADVDHRELSHLSRQATDCAAEASIDPDKPIQARQRIRDVLRESGLMQQMDDVISRILPDYSSKTPHK